MRTRSGMSVALLFGALMLAGAQVRAQQPGYGWGPRPMPRQQGLGVIVRDIPFPVLESLKLDYGVRIRRVVPGSPADKSGLRSGDVIISVDDRPVYSVDRLRWLVQETEETGDLSVKLHRGPETLTLVVHLARLSPDEGPPTPSHPFPGTEKAYLGVRLQPMTEELREAFGATAGSGILVAGITAGGPAAKAGLAVGDVIVEIGQKQIHDLQDIYRAMSFFAPGDTVDVVVVRNKQRQALKATLAESPGDPWSAAGPELPYPPAWQQMPYAPQWMDPLRDMLRRYRHPWNMPSTPQPGGGDGAL